MRTKETNWFARWQKLFSHDNGTTTSVHPKDMKGMDFEATIEELMAMSDKAQSTFIFKLVNAIKPSLLDTIIRYATKRKTSYYKQKDTGGGVNGQG